MSGDYWDRRVERLEKEIQSLQSQLKLAEEVLSLIAGGSDFQCEIGERNCIAAANGYFKNKESKDESST